MMNESLHRMKQIGCQVNTAVMDTAYLKVRKHSSMLMCQSFTVLSMEADRTN